MIHVLRHILTLGLLAGCGAVTATAGPSKPCGLETGSSQGVARVIDGETLQLDDGREVRLIGALAPKADRLRGATDWPPAEAARQALEALIGSRSVELRTQGRRRDRYGRELAQLFVVADGAKGAADAVWLQEALIRDGQARAYALPGNAGCLSELTAAEAEARGARRGLWSRDTYRVRDAADVSGLLRLAGQFVLVEGTVAAVARTAKMIYINFGADWRRDFTASLALGSLDQTPGDAARLQGLAGRKVRVRGWIERRNGPLVGLSTVDEIEILDEARESLPGETGKTGEAAISPAPNETAPR